MDVRTFVDRFWADAFGISIDALREPRVRVVAEPPWLTGYRGIYLLRIGEACVIGAPADIAELLVERVGGRAPDDVYTADAARGLIADDAGLVFGPSAHSYLDASTFVPPRACDARRLAPDDLTIVDAFRTEVDPAEWSEGGFGETSLGVEWGAFEDGRLVAMGNMTDFAGRPADVGLVTHPSARGHGYGTRLAAAMIADALATIPVVRYRALETNTASRRVARKLGFVDHGSNIALRLRA